MELGRAIRVARANRGMKQAELAQLLGVSPNYVSMLENDRRDPSWRFVCKLADALQTPLPLLILLASPEAMMDSRSSHTLASDLLKLVAGLRLE